MIAPKPLSRPHLLLAQLLLRLLERALTFLGRLTARRETSGPDLNWERTGEQ